MVRWLGANVARLLAACATLRHDSARAAGSPQANLPKRLAKLKRRASPVAHVDQHVEDPQELLSQNQRHRCVTMCEVLHQLRDARRNERSMPTFRSPRESKGLEYRETREPCAGETCC